MTRIVILASSVLLAGCAPGYVQGVYQPPPELVAAYDRQMRQSPPPSPIGRPDPRYIPPASTPAEMERRMAAETAAAARAERDQQAAVICAARAEMAGATYAGRGFGLSGALSAGIEAGIAAERVRAVCLDAYQRTGILPSY